MVIGVVVVSEPDDALTVVAIVCCSPTVEYDVPAVKADVRARLLLEVVGEILPLTLISVLYSQAPLN